MNARRTLGVLLAAALLAAGCGDDEDDRGLDAIEPPTFPAEDSDSPSTTDAGDDGSTTTTGAQPIEGGPPTTSVDSGGTSIPGASDDDSPAPLEKVSFDDPVGDATPGVGTGTPPAWTDLAGGSLERQGNAYRLTVRTGGEVPDKAPGSETMNIASFYDVDGDGSVDFEIWANLGPEGWGAAWYDDEDRGAFGEDSNVTVIVEGDEVRLLFPDVMLDQPDRLRFSTASEYGELSTIGSSFARRDDAPDNGEAVAFPS